MTPYVVIRAALIETADEARAYYTARLAGGRAVNCRGERVTIIFEADATHVFSEDPKGAAVVDAERVERRIPIGNGQHRVEVRRFSVARARLMDDVLRAVTFYVVSVAESGGPHGKRILHGPSLASGESMRIVLRPGPGDAWTCVSAYPVSAREVAAARRLKRAKFPP